MIAEYLKTAEPTVTQCEVHHSSFTNVETKWDAILNLLKTSKSAVDFVKRAQIEAKFLFLWYDELALIPISAFVCTIFAFALNG